MAIIILLILAGVTISLTIDSDGLFEQANASVEKSNNRMETDKKTENQIWEQINEEMSQQS